MRVPDGHTCWTDAVKPVVRQTQTTYDFPVVFIVTVPLSRTISEIQRLRWPKIVVFYTSPVDR